MNNFAKVYQKAFELADRYCSSDASHTRDHFERVLQLAEFLAKKEKVMDKIDWESLKLAVILHDLGQGHQVKELKKSQDKLASGKHKDQSLVIAEKFFQKEKVPQEQINKIKAIISSHGTHGESNGIEGDLLHDADLLDGIGLVGVFRKFTYGGQIGRGILGSLEFTKHKIENRKFRTKSAQKLGQKRIKQVKEWLEETEKELKGENLF